MAYGDAKMLSGKVFPSIFLLIFFSFSLQRSRAIEAAPDTILGGQMLRRNDTIISAGGKFELGFFCPGNSTDYYVGIWYKQISEQTVVWVANRDYKITGSSPSLTVNEDGNLAILDGSVIYMVSNISLALNTSATLLDSGNLVLRDGNSSILWQSFDYPSNTFLPGMKIGYNKRTGKVWSFTSWKNSEDPGLGSISLKLDPETHQFVIMWDSRTVWSSGVWNGNGSFSSVPEMRLNYIYNYSYSEDITEANFTYSLYDKYDNSTLSMLLIDVSGNIMQQTWLNSTQSWNIFWSVPRNLKCDVYSYCGAYSSCNNQTEPICHCLHGFTPNITGDWMKDIFRDGCARRTPLQCDGSGTTSVHNETDKFFKMDDVRFPQIPEIWETKPKETCQMACLNRCSCSAYAYNGSCLVWEGALLNLQQLSEKDPDGRTLYLKLAASEFESSRGNKMQWWMIVILVFALLVPLLASCFCYRRMKRAKDREETSTSHDILLYEFGRKATENDLTEGRVGKEKNKDALLPSFSFASVSAATKHFSTESKLGEGGFGPVYKGELSNGQEIAVKRLSLRSGQGLEELKNETVLLAELQHRNLVKLLGCCIEQGEKILIYEYMPNKSLDSFLFDPNKRGQLDWTKRVNIIEGIAQGLLYLHQYSRLRIIHRDLKASNILLDNDMNPKISDFGMARLFGGDELFANTKRIVGTYGYMSPEYALEGLCSTKSDVFSFGVLMLEMLSGKKNTGFYNSDTLNLISYAWELWEGDKAINLMDPMLEGQCSQYNLLRYINVGLLCVEEIAADRPTMSEVVSMLTNELAVLPSPKHPAFSTLRRMENPSSSSSRSEIYSANGLSLSVMQAR